MSPQLNRMVYGFFSHDWRQVLRGGGFRPMVFLQHGLWLAIFFCCSAIAIAGILRGCDATQRGKWYAALGWIALVMVLSKSLGALIVAIALVPVVLFLRVHVQLLIAAILAGTVLLYPVLRANDLIPTERIEMLAAKIDPNRAGSLGYRFDNEDILLEKAQEKRLFGWGIWGRARVFNEKGQDISTTDGYWVILLGEGGLVRYLAEYGLMAIPVILLYRRRREYDVGPATGALCLVLVANMVDTIPNAGLTPVTWLMAGALIGRVELGRITSETAAETAPADPRRHTRFAPGSRRRGQPPPDPGPVSATDPGAGTTRDRAQTARPARLPTSRHSPRQSLRRS